MRNSELDKIRFKSAIRREPDRRLMKTILLFPVLAVLVGCQGIRIERILKTGPHDWTTFGGTLTRVNQSSSSVTPPLRQIWQYDAGSGISATPLVRDSVVILCTLKGELHAVDAKRGKRIGYINIDGAVTGTPVWNGAWLYIPISTENETVESISANDGALNWRAKSGQCESSPLLYQKNIYATSLNGCLYCINAVNGEEVWKFSTDSEDVRKPIRSSPATDGERIVFGCDDGCVYAVERTTGSDGGSTKQGAASSPRRS